MRKEGGERGQSKANGQNAETMKENHTKVSLQFLLSSWCEHFHREIAPGGTPLLEDRQTRLPGAGLRKHWQ